jgi:hypothetical protein
MHLVDIVFVVGVGCGYASGVLAAADHTCHRARSPWNSGGAG